jgi:hypothetical protein
MEMVSAVGRILTVRPVSLSRFGEERGPGEEKRLARIANFLIGTGQSAYRG